MDTLLVELLTEELPPRALARLGRAFAQALLDDLRHEQLAVPKSAMRWFATPRRLAVALTNINAQAADRPIELQGPSVKAGLDAQGRPTPALAGFARKCGVPTEALEQRDTPKGKVFVYRSVARGVVLGLELADKVATALRSLPIPKMMRWGAGNAEFVRPVHGLVMLHGARLIPGEVLGVESGRQTLGHRFLATAPLVLTHADEYEQALRERGAVIASFETRRNEIAEALERAAGSDSMIARDDALLDEVTALTEMPAVYRGSFEREFLEVPQECLILSMKQHQKYFPLLDRASGKLLPTFLVVSNLKTDEPRNIIHGNERVLRARLADAKFFYDQDRRTPLEARVPQLAQVVFHNRLGTQLDRVERLTRLGAAIARMLQVDTTLAERAARLAKTDLLTGMVGEFPELQGTMGRYYALHDGEDPAVADAIETHYRPRFAGDVLPEGGLACAIALADKLELLAGLFGIGQQPTGEKDPYALRRHALGVIRILAERGLPLLLTQLIDQAFETFAGIRGFTAARSDLESFFFDRMRGYLGDSGASTTEIEAVLALRPDSIHLVPRQLDAVRIFNRLPEAPSLAAANKRIGNILKQAGRVLPQFDDALLVEPAERTLASDFAAARCDADRHFAEQDYAGMLRRLAALKDAVDAFFDGVMVMSEDVRLRDNRVALLAQLHGTMNRVADISKLAA